MRIPQLRMVQIFVQESIILYDEIKEARSADSDGGRTVTREEVFPIVLGFILRVGQQIEKSILGVNALSHAASVKWELIAVVAKNLGDLPHDIAAARGENTPGGARVTRAETVEIIGNALRHSVPKMCDIVHGQ